MNSKYEEWKMTHIWLPFQNYSLFVALCFFFTDSLLKGWVLQCLRREKFPIPIPGFYNVLKCEGGKKLNLCFSCWTGNAQLGHLKSMFVTYAIELNTRLRNTSELWMNEPLQRSLLCEWMNGCVGKQLVRYKKIICLDCGRAHAAKTKKKYFSIILDMKYYF